MRVPVAITFNDYASTILTLSAEYHRRHAVPGRQLVREATPAAVMEHCGRLYSNASGSPHREQYADRPLRLSRWHQ